jgi:hypothetical protein
MNLSFELKELKARVHKRTSFTFMYFRSPAVKGEWWKILLIGILAILVYYSLFWFGRKLIGNFLILLGLESFILPLLAFVFLFPIAIFIGTVSRATKKKYTTKQGKTMSNVIDDFTLIEFKKWVAENKLNVAIVERYILPYVQTEITDKKAYSLQSFFKKIIPQFVVGIPIALLSILFAIAIADQFITDHLTNEVLDLIMWIFIYCTVVLIFIGALIYKLLLPDFALFLKLEEQKIERAIYGYLIETEMNVKNVPRHRSG